MHPHKGGKKNRKHGRWLRKPANQRYTASRRWVKNKARKIARYMKRHPNWKPTNVSDEVRKLIE